VLEGQVKVDAVDRFHFGEHLAAELAAIDTFKPDLLVADNSLAGSLAAQIRGLRRAEIRNLVGYASHRGEQTGSLTPFPVDLGRIFHHLVQRAVNADRWSANPPAVVIVPGYPQFDMPQPTEAMLFYSGHLRWSGWRRLDDLDWQDELDPKKPTVLVTLGSSLPFPHVFQELVNPLVSAGFQVLANVGPLHWALDLPAAPGRLVVRERIDLKAAMEAVDIAIFHGGHGTAMEALLSATPALIIPFNGDQWGIAKRWQLLGLGRVLTSPPWQVDGREVVAAAQILSSVSSYKRRLEALQPTEAACCKGSWKAALYLDQVVPRHSRQVSHAR
jgi:hypothetical protein